MAIHPVYDKERLKNILNFLEEVYPLMKGVVEPIASAELNLRARLQHNKLGGEFTIALQHANIIERSGNNTAKSFYKWIAGEPTAEMATNVLQAVRNEGARRTRNSHDKEKAPHTKKENSTMKRTVSLDPKKLQNIKEFLDDLYVLLKGVKTPVLVVSLHVKDKLQKRKLKGSTSKAIVDLGIVERTGGGANSFAYKWIAGKPTIEMAEQVYVRSKSISQEYNAKSLLKKAVVKTTNKDGSTRKPYTKNPEAKTSSVKLPSSKKEAWKEVAKKFIDLDDPESALAALNKLN